MNIESFIYPFCLINWNPDELIIAKEHFAEIGDDLDFTFVDLIDGIDPIWTYRRPKPPTPPPKEPSPPKEVAQVAAPLESALQSGDQLAAAVTSGEDGSSSELTAGSAAPKEPSPFELTKHFPPDGAEVPFVKSFETSPEAEPTKPTEPTPAPEEPKSEEPLPTETVAEPQQEAQPEAQSEAAPEAQPEEPTPAE